MTRKQTPMERAIAALEHGIRDAKVADDLEGIEEIEQVTDKLYAHQIVAGILHNALRNRSLNLNGDISS